MILELAEIEASVRHCFLRWQAVVEILHQAAQAKAHSLVKALAHVKLRLEGVLFRAIRIFRDPIFMREVDKAQVHQVSQIGTLFRFNAKRGGNGLVHLIRLPIESFLRGYYVPQRGACPVLQRIMITIIVKRRITVV